VTAVEQSIAPAAEIHFSTGHRPWGELQIHPIAICAPPDFVRRYFFETKPQPWRFPRLSADQTAQLLWRCGATPVAISRLMSQARVDEQIAGTSILADDASVRELSPQVRSALYQWLGSADRNSLQGEAFRYCGASLEEWFRDAPLKEETIELVRPFIYRQGSFLRFADLPAVAPLFADQEELFRLVRVLASEQTKLMKLHIRGAGEVDSLVEYWGRGRRTKDIRPLMESVSRFRGGHTIDILHLLPPFARRVLYTFPSPALDGRDNSRNCFWTAFNFFNDEVDDRLLDLAYVGRTLERDWQLVDGQPLLGDVAMFHDERDHAFHAAAYIADGMLFSKNGPGIGRPWLLMDLEDLRHYYGGDEALEVSYYRRRDLV
jgi:hypothetical protein